MKTRILHVMSNKYCDYVFSFFSLCLSVQEMSGQQQTSSVESEFDFPQDDNAFSSSEFREEGVDFTVDHTGSSDEAGAHHSAAGASHVSGKQSLFEGYKDPSKQFSGHPRSYHQDARYEECLTLLQIIVYMFMLLGFFWIKVITIAFGVADISLDLTISTTTV